MRFCLFVIAAAAAISAFTSTAACADKYDVLYRFTGGSDGGTPESGLIADAVGNLFGTTYRGGGGNGCGGLECGTVYKLDATGVETVLYRFFGGSDGGNPEANLIADKKGNLYSTTRIGGTGCTFGCGTVFKLSATGAETVLYAFKGDSDGAEPWAGLIEGSDGNFYGTTWQGGGSGCEGYGCGTVFKLSKKGVETVVYAFKGGIDGSGPMSNLIFDPQGDLFGTTGGGGKFGVGTVFKIAPDGTETVLYTFKGGTDGAYPSAGLIADKNGNLFGTTEMGGGTDCNGYQFGCGTVYEVSASGNESLLYAFNGDDDGQFPNGSLVADNKGDLYGTTQQSGAFGWGNVFKLASNGTLKVLHAFGSDQNDGGTSVAGLILRHGYLYGTTSRTVGDCTECGTVFKVRK